jgi:hypothetical protein
MMVLPTSGNHPPNPKEPAMPTARRVEPAESTEAVDDDTEAHRFSKRVEPATEAVDDDTEGHAKTTKF